MTTDNGLNVHKTGCGNIDISDSVFLKAKYINNPFANNTLIDTFKYTNVPIKSKRLSRSQVFKQKFADFVNMQQLNSLANKKEIEIMLMANPKIEEILQSNNIKKNICLENLSNGAKAHFVDTAKLAKKIGENLGLSKREIKLTEQGALLHDFGKVLIPANLLKKPCGLTLEERKIVSLHANLGYELLKTKNIEPEVLEIIKNHHKYNLKSKYNPKLSQIVTVADIYSALTIDRPYKKAISMQQACKILDKIVDEGKLDKSIVSALKKVL